jgi:hypothetical protein
MGIGDGAGNGNVDVVGYGEAVSKQESGEHLQLVS